MRNTFRALVRNEGRGEKGGLLSQRRVKALKKKKIERIQKEGRKKSD